LPQSVITALILGAATVLTSAWGLGLLSRHGLLRTHRFAMATDGSHVWAVNQMRSIGWRRTDWQCIDFLQEDASDTRRENFLADIYSPREYGEDPRAGMRRVRPKLGSVEFDGNGLPISTIEYAVGFPWPALWCGLYEENPTLPPEALGWRGGIALWPPITGAYRSSAELGALPYRPHWPGLLGNLGVWTLAWVGVLVAVPAWCRHRRRRRGWCPQCGYDLGGAINAICPECGWNKDPKLPP